MLIDNLVQAKITAMKEKNDIAKKILSLLHSDALKIAKNELRKLTEDDIIKSAKNLIKKNNQAMAEAKEKVGMEIPSLIKENEILETFLPQQISEEEIKKVIDIMINNFPEIERIKRNQGKIMKELKEKYGNTIDMGFAAKYLSGKLN